MKIFQQKKIVLKSTNADLRSVYNGLVSEIKLRHYSPKTLEAYRGWADVRDKTIDSKIDLW